MDASRREADGRSIMLDEFVADTYLNGNSGEAICQTRHGHSQVTVDSFNQPVWAAFRGVHNGRSSSGCSSTRAY